MSTEGPAAAPDATPPGVSDYPLAETRPDSVRGPRGKALSEITLEAVLSGEIGVEDLRITAEALRDQAAIARDAGRVTLAGNFERAAELVAVPNETIMATYELLRPGRARSRDEILAQAGLLRARWGAERIAAFLEEAAEVYERRGLFRRRY